MHRVAHGVAGGGGVNRGDEAVNAVGTAAGEGLRPVVVPDAVRVVVVADADVLEVFADDGVVVVRAVAPGLDDAGGTAVFVGADVFGKRAAPAEIGVVERVGAVSAFVLNLLPLGGELFGADGGVGGEAVVVSEGREAFFRAQLVGGGEGFVQLGTGGGVRAGDAARRQHDVAEADVFQHRLRFVVRRGDRRRGFGVGRGVIVAPAPAAGGEQERDEEADGSVQFHGGFLCGCNNRFETNVRKASFGSLPCRAC